MHVFINLCLLICIIFCLQPVPEKWSDRKIMLHYGGDFLTEESDVGALYKYEGGRVYDLGSVFGGGLTFDNFKKMITVVFTRNGAKNICIYALNEGVKFRVDDDDDLNFQWQILPFDELGYTHFYCFNENDFDSPLKTIPKDPITSSQTEQPPSLKKLADTPPRSTRSKSHLSPLVPELSNKSPLKKLPVKRKLPTEISDITPEADFDLFVDFTHFGDVCTQESQGITNQLQTDMVFFC